MNRIALTILLGVACLNAALRAAESPFSAEAKAAYQFVKADLLKAAEKMPESDYSFKPEGEGRTFGELIAHVADAQFGICGLAQGQPRKGDAASKTSKADLVAALKASTEFCDGVYGSMTDQAGSAIVKTPFGEKPKLGVLIFNTAHDNESYGTIAVYLRLKGIVPPSSEMK